LSEDLCLVVVVVVEAEEEEEEDQGAFVEPVSIQFMIQFIGVREL